MKNQKWRTFSRILLMVLVTIHIITWYVLEIQEVGSIGIEALFAGLSQGVINAGFIFWMIVFGSTLIMGRAFCGWFCWFGGYQELVAWSIGDRFKLKIPRHILLYLGLIPVVSLGLKIYYSWIINWMDGIPPSFTFNLANIEPWGGQQTGISILITLILYGPVLIYVFGRRAWCRHLCPIGALLKLFSFLRPVKVRLINNNCLGCGNCTAICDMEIDVSGELANYQEVRDINCNACLICIDQCPSQSLKFTFKQTESEISTKAKKRINKRSYARRKSSFFDLSITVLWISIVLIFSFTGLRQNAPQEIKTLMTPGLLLVIYGLLVLARQVWVIRGEKNN
jgi:polyferredoxin